MTAITDNQWHALQAQLPFLAELPAPMQERVRELVPRFLATKSIVGAAGLAVSEPMALVVATQACLPINRLNMDWYGDFEQVILYPGPFRINREQMDENGVIHRVSGVLAGEVMPGGPVVLSWPDSRDPGDADQPTNVVIHEFAHKLDMASGHADGSPPLRGADADQWNAALQHAYADFCAQVNKAENSIPINLDPESAAAEPYWAPLGLDPYAATDLAEFFAVASEAYFVGPGRLQAAFSQLFAMMEKLYGPLSGPDF